jgi:hypothetical protein
MPPKEAGYRRGKPLRNAMQRAAKQKSFRDSSELRRAGEDCSFGGIFAGVDVLPDSSMEFSGMQRIVALVSSFIFSSVSVR